jgi:biotin transport system substrate-specific component
MRLPVRLIWVAALTVLTIISARISIPFEPVPFTMQPLAVLLSGMILGSRDGALSQLFYVALIAIGLPVDANARGQAALLSPTGGFLIGFIFAAFVSGWLVEHGANRLWQRWLAGIAGIAVIYAFGIPVLALRTGMTLDAAIALMLPYIPPDLVKAVIAAALTEGGRALISRFGAGNSNPM